MRSCVYNPRSETNKYKNNSKSYSLQIICTCKGHTDIYEELKVDALITKKVHIMVCSMYKYMLHNDFRFSEIFLNFTLLFNHLAIISRKIVSFSKLGTYSSLCLLGTVWKLREFSLTQFWEKLRESNGLLNKLQKS